MNKVKSYIKKHPKFTILIIVVVFLILPILSGLILISQLNTFLSIFGTTAPKVSIDQTISPSISITPTETPEGPEAFKMPHGYLQSSYKELSPYSPITDLDIGNTSNIQKYQDYIFVASSNLLIFDAEGELQYTISGNNTYCTRVNSITFVIKDDYIFLTCGNDLSDHGFKHSNRVEQIDLNTGTIVNSWDVNDGIVSTLNPQLIFHDGKLFLSAMGGNIAMIDYINDTVTPYNVPALSNGAAKLVKVNNTLLGLKNGNLEYVVWNGSDWTAFNAPELYKYFFIDSGRLKIITANNNIHEYKADTNTFKQLEHISGDYGDYLYGVINKIENETLHYQVIDNYAYFLDNGKRIKLQLPLISATLVSTDKTDNGYYFTTLNGMYFSSGDSLKITELSKFSEKTFEKLEYVSNGEIIKNANNNFYDYENNTLYILVSTTCIDWCEKSMEENTQIHSYILEYNYKDNTYEAHYFSNGGVTIGNLKFSWEADRESYTIKNLTTGNMRTLDVN